MRRYTTTRHPYLIVLQYILSAGTIIVGRFIIGLLDRYKESYILELEKFFKSISENKPCMVTGKDGLMPVILGLAAKQSLKEKRPVTIELDATSEQ
ncbi:MAG: hypothetical protein A3F67_00980 [Verrucomicrobia bacterium RIFCSPHIGHO2_12_FULL_41_10]|nr:MAG: hypothetical protein A3F67_00980 [Verrucomicrobia bacterium RIFCSPHIGHO2_12_FULL_41_10]